jgi:hypothetical protein
MTSFWSWFWLLIWSFIFVMYLMLLFQIFADLFRDRELSGWAKAAWIIGLILIPFLMALIYVITRGSGMADRQLARVQAAQTETAQYIKSVASQSSPADEIASAKSLLDSGAITQDEFAQMKAKALS